MSTQATERPVEGGDCTRCGNGRLYLLATTKEGVYLGCFNCGTRGTVPTEGEWVASVDPTQVSPTGFQVTHDQLAAQQAAGGDQEQAADRSRRHDAETAAATADLAERDSRIAELQRQLDEARANPQPTPEGGQQ